MRGFKLSRRAVMRGAGSIAIALPWLELMGTRHAGAQSSAPASRFLAVYTPGGAMQTPQQGSQRYWPSGSEAAPNLSPILAPLEPIKHKLLTLRGLRLACGNEANDAAPHDSGCVGLFTGSEQRMQPAGYSSLPSIDQVLATRFSNGQRQKASLQLAVRWATGLTNGRLHSQNAICFEDSPTAAPIPPAVDPVAIYRDLFGQLARSDPTQADPITAGTKSILDFVDKKYVSLMAQLGSADKAKLEQHLEKIREIERSLTLGVVAGGKCQAPPQVDTSTYNPNDGLNAEDDNSGLKNGTDAAIPVVGKYMMDMMIMALACDITAVGLLQWSDSEAQHSLPWLNLLEHHHFYQHDGGYRPPELEQIGTWYSQQHFYLLDQMDKVDMGGHSLLDESVVMFGSEIGWPESHAQDNVPIMLAGRGGGLRPGRHLDFRTNKADDSDPGIPHNNLLVSILNLFGDTRTSYQQAGRNYCNAPITLT